MGRSLVFCLRAAALLSASELVFRFALFDLQWTLLHLNRRLRTGAVSRTCSRSDGLARFNKTES